MPHKKKEGKGKWRKGEMKGRKKNVCDVLAKNFGSYPGQLGTYICCKICCTTSLSRFQLTSCIIECVTPKVDVIAQTCLQSFFFFQIPTNFHRGKPAGKSYAHNPRAFKAGERKTSRTQETKKTSRTQEPQETQANAGKKHKPRKRIQNTRGRRRQGERAKKLGRFPAITSPTPQHFRFRLGNAAGVSV